MTTLGDMAVLGDVQPAKLWKALAVIADTLHPAFAAQPWIAHADKSKESCILCSLAVRDFLNKIGFDDAMVRSVIVVMKAWQGDKELHSLGIGVPGTPKNEDDGRWVGHMVVWLPSLKTLIDTTLYQSIRPQWKDVSPMIAVRCDEPMLERYGGMKVIAALRMTDTDVEDYEFGIVWLDRPRKSWCKGGDAHPWRRAVVVEAMRAKFGEWHE